MMEFIEGLVPSVGGDCEENTCDAILKTVYGMSKKSKLLRLGSMPDQQSSQRQ